MNYIRSQVQRIFQNQGCKEESGFDPVDLWVMGPPCGLKVGRAETSCVIMQARYVRGWPVDFVSNNVGTKGEGRREPFSCSLNEADQ